MSVAEVWNKEYYAGRYVGEPPLEFAKEIIVEVGQRHNSRGLYVGCGNGRNYLEFVRAGLDVVGLDVSTIGLAQISKRKPSLAHKLVCSDFLDYYGRFDYIIAIQSFQHGDYAKVTRYFQKAAEMLNVGGILFVRVNAVGTDIGHPHHIIESRDGGFTIQYEGGPKNGLYIHFFSYNELINMMIGSGLYIKRLPKKVVTQRPNGNGSWSQWEVVAGREIT